MNTKSLLTVLILLTAALASCTPAPGGSTHSPAPSLDGTKWQLLTLDGLGPLMGTIITAAFSNSEIGGSSGCNSYSGSYTLVGGSIQFGDIGGTEMACLDPEGVMDQEQSFLRTLHRVASYRLGTGQLELLDVAGSAVLVFTASLPLPEVPMEGTAWTLTTFVDGEVASSLLSGTEITLSFENGTASGSAGCNRYGGSYTLGQGTLRVPEIDITEQLCLEPDGIMEQETRYLDTLKSVRSFELDANQLVLRTNDGRGLVCVAPTHPTPTTSVAGFSTPGQEASCPVITAENASSLRPLSTSLPGTFLAWTPEGDSIATAAGGTVQVLDVRTGQPVGAPIDIGEPVGAAEYAPDGSILALYPSEPYTPVVLWDTIADRPLNVWNSRIVGATNIAFSTDGQTLATGYPDGSIRLWNAATGENTRTFSTLEVLTGGGKVFGVHLSTNGQTLAAFATTVEGVPIVLLWNTPSGEALDSYAPQGLITGPVAYPLLAPDWQYVIWVSRGSVILLDPATGQEAQRLNHEDSVVAVAFSPDGSLLATSAYRTIDGAFSPAVTAWDTGTGGEVATLSGFASAPAALGFSPDGTALAISTEGQTQLFAAK